MLKHLTSLWGLKVKQDKKGNKGGLCSRDFRKLREYNSLSRISIPQVRTSLKITR